MERQTQLRLTQKLQKFVAAGAANDQPAFSISRARYLDPGWLQRERSLFGPGSRWPRVVAASAELPRGGCLPADTPGAALLLVRSDDGTARAFANACRHRMTRLVNAPCQKKALVCPYHGWTYDHAGSLLHVPHRETFAGIDLEQRGLKQLPLLEQNGLLWSGHAAHDCLAPLADDLAALSLGDSVVYRRSRSTHRCNWKLLVEAFLDGYHIRSLHRNSIYPFFLDGASIAEPVGPHIRALTGRRALRDAPQDLSGLDLHQLGTPSYLVFPSTIIIEHPDFVSIVDAQPLASDATEFHHTMLVPAKRATDSEHWRRSWALIHDAVFVSEDLWVCEQIQAGLSAGAGDELVFGSLEHPVRWFHDELERALAPTPAP